MESMSNIPYYLPKARLGYRMGHNSVLDGMIHDGLWDPHLDQHMGKCAESCAQAYGITRAQQDDHALETFRRATEAAMSGATGMVHDQAAVCSYLSLWPSSNDYILNPQPFLGRTRFTERFSSHLLL